MDKYTCKHCSRSFANGRALGGHMRSHVITNKPGPFTHTASVTPTSSSSSGMMEAADLEKKSTAQAVDGVVGGGGGVGTHYELRENPRKSFKFYETEFAGVDYSSFVQLTATAPNNSASVVVQDRESDTETSMPTSNTNFRRRSKRRRRRQRTPTVVLPSEIEPMSSVSDNTPDEDVARCLIMLSRDIWSKNRSTHNLQQAQHQADLSLREDAKEDGEEEEEEEEEEEFTLVFSSDDEEQRKRRVKKKGIGNGGKKPRFQCGACKKVFQSYQALGGHRASHKKIKSCHEEQLGSKEIREFEDGDELNGTPTPRLHECPFCFRMFISGQALGGHKRSHLVAGHTIPINPPPPPTVSTKTEEKLLDLNLPAPLENDEENAEFSTVSEAC